MANLRNESRFHKKYTKTNMGGKIPKKRPKRLANLWNESKLYKKIHQNKNRPKRLANLRNESKLYKKIHQNKNRAKGKIPKRPQITSIFFSSPTQNPTQIFRLGRASDMQTQFYRVKLWVTMNPIRPNITPSSLLGKGFPTKLIPPSC